MTTASSFVSGASSGWRRLALWLVMLVSLAATAFCLLFLFWNIIQILDKFGLATLTVGESNPEALWSRTAKFLRECSVDLSGQTPFKLTLFFSLVLVASMRSLRGTLDGRQLVEGIRSLPFFRGMETTFVQLGLAGSIWGFLIIGFSLRPKTSVEGAAATAGAAVATKAVDLNILLEGFGTALLSTFTGVVLAYILAPLVRSLWRWLHGLPLVVSPAALGLTTGVSTLKGSFDAAIPRVDDMRKALETTASSAKDLRVSVEAVQKQLEGIDLRTPVADLARTANSTEKIDATLGTMATVLRNAAADGAAVKDVIAEVLQQLKAIAIHQGSIADSARRTVEALSVLGQIRADVSALSQIRTDVGDLKKDVPAMAAAQEVHHQQLAGQLIEIQLVLERMESTLAVRPVAAAAYQPPHADGFDPNVIGPPPSQPTRERTWFSFLRPRRRPNP
jgi:hypothetical protein